MLSGLYVGWCGRVGLCWLKLLKDVVSRIGSVLLYVCLICWVCLYCVWW